MGNQLDSIVELLGQQSGSTESFESVTTWSELPAAPEHSGSLYLVRQSSGVPLVSFHGSGWYRSNGATWDKLADYDPTATNSALTDIKAVLDGTLDVAITNLPAVQPVSDNGASLTVDGTVNIGNLPVSQPVTGTFFQATQPVSAAALPLPTGASTEATLAAIKAKTDNLDVALSTRTKPADTQPVSAAALPLPAGASTEATLALIKAKTDNLDVALSTRTKPADTQAISAATLPLPAGAATSAKQDTGNTSVGSIDTKTPALGQAAMAASTPVVIASNQSTVPVSLAVAPSTPVTGTFWQATQPVSGTFFQATQPVSAAALPLPAGAATEATLSAMSAKLPASLGQKATAAAMAVVIASDQSVIPVSAPTLTKGTQGANGFMVQEIKDSGRTHMNFSAVGAAAGATGVETMITLTKSSGTGATANASTFVVTSGKTFRMTSITFATRGHLTATAQVTTFNIRINTGGAVIASSAPVVLSARCATPATALAWDRFTIPLGDGYEIVGNGTIQFGVSANAVFVTNAPTWDVCITGYEY